jgi:hypothetical protein
VLTVLTGDKLLDCLRAAGVDSTYFVPTSAAAPPWTMSAVISARGTPFLGTTDLDGITLHTYRRSFGLGGASHYAPGLVRLANGRVRVFVTGTNGALYSRDVQPDSTTNPLGIGTWHKWGGSIVGRPSPVLMPDGSIGVYVHATNGRVYQAMFAPSGAFLRWVNLNGPALVPGSGPGAASTGSGRVVVAANGGRTGVWVRSFQPGVGWSAWSSIGGSAFGAVTGISPSAGVFEVYTTTAAASPVDRDVRTRRLVSGRWGSWQSLGGRVYDSPAAAVSGTTTMVWVVGANLGEYQRNRTSAGWGSWYRLG